MKKHAACADISGGYMTVTMNKFKVGMSEIQQSKVIKMMGCCRFVHNHFLMLNRDLCKEGQKMLSVEEMRVVLKDMLKKEEYSWLNEADFSSLDDVLKELDSHLQTYSDGRGEYPQLTSKKAGCQSYRIRNENDCLAAGGFTISLPVIGDVTSKQQLPSEGKILYATVFRTSSNHYFVCLAIETDDIPEE